MFFSHFSNAYVRSTHARGSKSVWKERLDLLEQSAQGLLQRETVDEPDLVAIGSKVKRTEAVAA
ncbi:hypothetical protein GN316_28225 [Xylophilus sp. Kf1]|nr:hypothetical protein [Xylophilus sp. Kf1]